MREEQYQQLLSAGRTLVETREIESVLERLLETARQVTGSRYAALGILDDERRRLRRFLTVGLDDDARRRIGDLPQGRGVLGELIRHPALLRLEAVGDHPRSYGFPPGHPPMDSFLGAPVVIAGEPFGNLYLTEKEGGFDAGDEEAIAVIAEWAAVAIENARLHESVTRQRDELQRAVETLEATTSIARALAGETDLDRVLELIAKRGRAVVDAELLVITLVRGDEIVIAAAAGKGAADLHPRSAPAEDSTTARVLESRRALRFGASAPNDFAQRGLARFAIDAHSGLVVPLVFRQQGIGALMAVNRSAGEDFTDDHQRLLEAFAVSAATAVGTAQNVSDEQARRRLEATEEERRRWARELHDETLQELAALRIGLAVAQRLEDPEELRGVVRQAVGDLDSRIAGLRGLIADVRPGALDELGFAAAVEDLVDRVRARDLEVALAVDLDWEAGRVAQRMVPELEDALYRLTQEALTNILKHAGATSAQVRVQETGGAVELVVSDDGAGFDRGELTAGFGLLGMRERVELLGGRLDLDSQPGEGTRIHVRLPVRRRANPAEETVESPRSAAR
jgi:signal transduction histidine kinase